MERYFHALAMAVLAAAAVFLPGCGVATAPPEATELPGGSVDVPMATDQETLLVDVMINGQGPFTFFIDTGSQSTMIVFKDLAERFADTTIPAFAFSTDIFGNILFKDRLLHLDEVRVGGATFRGVNSSIFPDRLGPCDSADGALGYPFFRDALLTLDFTNGLLRLESGQLAPPDGREIFPLVGIQDAPVMDLDLGGQSFRSLVDTGLTSTMIVPNSPAAGLTYAYGPVPYHEVRGWFGQERYAAGRLSGSLRIGPYEIASPAVMTGPGGTILGEEILQYFTVTFDQNTEAIRLRRDDPAPIDTPSWYTVGFSLDRDDAGWFVNDVIPGSPAESLGLRTNDRVNTVNGVPPGEIWCELALTETDLVTLELIRDDGYTTVSIPLHKVVP